MLIRWNNQISLRNCQYDDAVLLDFSSSRSAYFTSPCPLIPFLEKMMPNLMIPSLV